MSIIAFLVTLTNLLLAVFFFNKSFICSLPWANFGINFSLRLYPFSSFIILAAAFFGFLVTVYCLAFLKDKKYANQFYACLLLSIICVNGAVLADNLIVMLFFWEGLLIPIFALIAIGSKNAFKTATKALIIVGISDLCLMLGIGLTYYLTQTLTVSNILIPATALGNLAFILLAIGAVSKAGSMPFHSWIPDAGLDAPLPFMAILPASLEKLLGIYFLTRLSLDLFKLSPGSILSPLLMTLGVITIILAVMMALIQKNYKRLLAYHAVSQVGYMILGIGTALPAGIIGGLFHMINNALYKSCLFLTGGNVEKQTNTTDLGQLGGLGWKMPVTFICFTIAALSISGVPPFNGFFSKELVYEAALSRGWIFYFIAVLGSFFTAASFLKLGHAAYLGKPSQRATQAKEAAWLMLLPIIIIAIFCLGFGLFSSWPINYLLTPVLGHNSSSVHQFILNPFLPAVTIFVLVFALLNHLVGLRINGSGLKAVDHIHYAPVLKQVYNLAEKKFFDPYDLGLKISGALAVGCFWFDGLIDKFYSRLAPGLAFFVSRALKSAHNGNYAFYIGWVIAGTALLIYWGVR